MKTISILAAGVLALFSIAIAGDTPANIQAALDSPDRSDNNRASDADRKPAKALAFFGVEEGMSVADLAAGGGYFTEILSGAVGPDGEVIAYYPANQNFESGKDALKAQYAPFGNIEIVSAPRGEPFPIDDSSMDMVLLSQIIHHLHYTEDSGEEMPASSAAIYAEIMRVLKPGGVFAVIEHTAAPGTTRAESAGWHRAPEDIIKADVTSAGFEFDGAADIHVNPNDDLKNNFFESGLRGKTTRMVHRYVKPWM
ncbi:class I SAM-dependent methyltransferase [Hyphococcus sp.]|uniref:class I SAM-dependent methyltransferase n=1 Tax=Hyphococcus sp. TaxID=2038636 RepID=UPI003CCC3CC5